MILSKNSFMQKSRFIVCLTAAAVALYLCFVFYSRWRDNQALIQRLKAPAAARDRAFAEAYGGGIKILSFYAVPSILRQGETAQLCYGVANAESVRIEPPPGEAVWPSRSRCVPVAPRADTRYRIFARDNTGNTETADLTVTVHQK